MTVRRRKQALWAAVTAAVAVVCAAAAVDRTLADYDDRAKRGGAWVFTTYGREPAVELSFKEGRRPAGDALVALHDSLRGLTRKSKCLALSDT
ncbi:hypothetical protein OOK31_16640 [Streptomyces sp. NBC_00249]|uniref:hypothetical protein n=1 Tax=Streptomyces sp. NBC_00249 TaxID=2975690 RepID=UPI0022560E70|nr:hypothetical protein [Streptomyces sp. NBC_00249]MCX5195513.1 hypothetical protein [Streptomyces sp. NBC_00249]